METNGTIMHRLSARRMWISKRAMPIIVLVALPVIAVLAALDVNSPGGGGHANWGFSAFFLLWGAAFLFHWWTKTRELADEVQDAGDHLVIVRGAARHSVYFDQVINVNWSPEASPRRVTVTFREVGPFGSSISYLPLRGPIFGSVVDDLRTLVKRIDASRQRR